jgi:hypothetical protein
VELEVFSLDSKITSSLEPSSNQFYKIGNEFSIFITANTPNNLKNVNSPKICAQALFSHLHQYKDSDFRDINFDKSEFKKTFICTWLKKCLEDSFNSSTCLKEIIDNYEALLKQTDNVFIVQISQQQPNHVYLNKLLISLAQNYEVGFNCLLITKSGVLTFSIGDGDILSFTIDGLTNLTPTLKQFAFLNDNTYLLGSASEYNFLDTCGHNGFILKYTKFNNINPKWYETSFDPYFIIVSNDGFKNAFFNTKHLEVKLNEIHNLFIEKKFKQFASNSQKFITNLAKQSIYQQDINMLLIVFKSKYQKKRIKHV